MIIDDSLKKIFKLVSLETKISESTIEVMYRLYWRFIKEKLESVPLREVLNKEEFKKHKTSINMPSLGKIFVSYEKYEGLAKRYKYMQQLRNKGEEHVKD